MDYDTRRTVAIITQEIHNDGSVGLTFRDIDPTTGETVRIFHDVYTDPQKAASFAMDAAARYTAPRIREYLTRAEPTRTDPPTTDAPPTNGRNVADIPSTQDMQTRSCGCRVLTSSNALISTCAEHADTRTR